jgi:hypothetical protein
VLFRSIFAKNAKLNYTDYDIDRNHPSEGLNAKLKMALRYLPKLGIKGILQGDMMFTKGDLKKETIDGESYITFQPNTIVYAVPTNSKLAQIMMAAQVGIVFHTSYAGQKMEDMKASFNIDIGRLATTKDVWFRDASFTDASGSATFTEEETKQITTILALAGRTFQTIPALTLNRIASSDTILEYIKTFNNTKVREGKKITDTRAHTLELVRFVEAKLNKEISSVKREETKRKDHILFDMAAPPTKQARPLFSSHLSTSCSHLWKKEKWSLTRLCLRRRKTSRAIPKQGFRRGTISSGNAATATSSTFWTEK